VEQRMTNLDVVHHEAEKRFSQLERQLRMNEERWGAVIANPFITVLDKNQYFIMANATFQAMVGYTEDELRKLTPLDITPST
jgi:PAS domain-containing protein